MSDTPDLFAAGPHSPGAHSLGDADPTDPAASPGSAGGDLPNAARNAPLAARMRPRSLDDFEGQGQLLGAGRALRVMLERGDLTSMIFWGPPGSGKTTLARLVAERAGLHFVPFSAVTEGIGRVREIIAEAEVRRRAGGPGTLLFCDEIHRFNRAQQDAFLPHVEAGTVTLVGATTENPSFEIVRPLLSRAPVFVLEALDVDALTRILARALGDVERGLGSADITCPAPSLRLIAESADGDARRALGVLEVAARLVGPQGSIDEASVREALQHRFAVYDKGGEEHYNLISALHKSVRGSDPDAALYWLARMIEGGEDPLYIARRLTRIASEDVGLADPHALEVTLAARESWRFLGSPEGELALAEATVYLALAPKSNRIYRAWSDARAAARKSPGAAVPLHLRNAPTRLMNELGYGAGYRYDPETAEGVSAQDYLPDSLASSRFYRPGRYGFEKQLEERQRWFEAQRARARQREHRDAENERAPRPSDGDPDPR